MKLYYNSATEAAPIVIDGDPPVDQSAALATAQARIMALESAIAEIKARANTRKTTDAATVEGQTDLDAIAALGL